MKARILFCLPTYNNPNTVTEVALALLAQSAYDLLVVDDGSHRSVEEIFAEKLAEEKLPEEIRRRIFHLRTQENMGKGMALRKAFAWAIPRGYTHLIAVDADGQHPPSEALKIEAAVEKNPAALIIGHRNMEGREVPPVSKFGRKFSNFWVRYQTNETVLDSQSGLRGYPLFQLQNFKFFTKRYDFEIEILIRLIWKKVPIVEVPVDVVYHPKEVRVSHFRKFWDNARISALNAILVIVSLLREKTSPVRLASALGLGVWIGCTPLYGLHTVISAAFSFFFQLNFVALVVGTQISTPPLLPILLPAATAIGRHFHGFHKAERFIFGSLVLGVILGLIAFFVSWSILAAAAKKHKEVPKWEGEQRGGRFGNWILKQILLRFGLRAAYACVFVFVLPYFYLFNGKARRAASEYWTIIAPELNFFSRQRKIFAQMYVFAQVMLDSLYFSLRSSEEFAFAKHGQAELDACYAQGRGLVMMTAHAGAWEFSARAFQERNADKRLSVVRFEGTGLTFAKVRAPAANYGEILVNQGQLPILEIRENLRRGEIISMMGDRPVSKNTELFVFFGKLVVVDLTPFRIAQACGSPLFYAFGFREGYRQYSFTMGEISLTKNFPQDDELHFLAESYLKHLETLLRRYPEQWFNWYTFFSA